MLIKRLNARQSICFEVTVGGGAWEPGTPVGGNFLLHKKISLHAPVELRNIQQKLNVDIMDFKECRIRTTAIYGEFWCITFKKYEAKILTW